MRLEECTKAELISIIHRICGRLTPTNEDYYIQWSLNDIKYQRELKQIHKADEYGKKADEARKQYCEFLKKHKGKSLTDIPSDEVEKAIELVKLADYNDKEYLKLLKQR